MFYLRPWYVGRVNDKAGKDLVLVIDYSQNALKHREKLIELVELLIDSIDSKDRVSESICQSTILSTILQSNLQLKGNCFTSETSFDGKFRQIK